MMCKAIKGYFVLMAVAFSGYAQSVNRIDGTIYSPKRANLGDTLIKKESSVIDYIGIYQKYISGIRGQHCSMYPSCSEFGSKTFNETNLLSAFVLTSDRLLRCGHDLRFYSLTIRPHGYRFLDYPSYAKVPADLYYTRNVYFFAYADTIRDEAIIRFVKTLINKGYYQEALSEILRYEFLHGFNTELFINKIICLKAIGEYEKALYEYETQCPPYAKENSELLYQIALIEYNLQNIDRSLKVCVQGMKNCSDSYLMARYLILNGLIYAHQDNWHGALQCFQSLSGFDSFKNISEANTKIVEKAFGLKYKNPKIAVLFSIMPGGGYAYAGHIQTALASLILNGLLAYATYTNFKKENYGMGLLTGVFNLSFYIANIYGSGKSAKRYNEKLRKNIIIRLENNSNL